MLHLHPYNLGSKSIMALKGYLTEHGIRAIVSHRLMSNRKRMFVGWGSKDFGFVPNSNIILNSPQNTKLLSCKRRFFGYASRDDNARNFLPDFTSDRSIASQWNDTVVVRHTTVGSGGEGIELIEPGKEIPHAPLYTRYQKKTHEYRLHVLGGEVREIQRKVFVKSEDNPEPEDWRIRNHTKGFIFQTEEDCPERVREAVLVVHSVFAEQGLDFAAWDVIYHKPTDSAFILEGNTAPGLEGPRLGIYGDFLISKYKELM